MVGQIKKHRLWFSWPESSPCRKVSFFWHELCKGRRLHTNSPLRLQLLPESLVMRLAGIWILLFCRPLRIPRNLIWQIHQQFGELKINSCVLLLWKGAFWMRRSVDFWNFLISLRAALPGLDLLFWTGSLTPVVTGADFLEIFCEARFFLAGSRVFAFSVCLALALERGISEK